MPREPGLAVVRCSVGRIGEEAVLQRDDADLAALAAAELADATGVRGPPADGRVTRWGGALPQYTVGHLDRVARIRRGVGQPARPGRVRRGLRRHRHPGLHRHRPGAAARSQVPGAAGTARSSTGPGGGQWRHGTADGTATGSAPRGAMADDEVTARSPEPGSDTKALPATRSRSQRRERPRARDLNELIRYTMWSVFRVTRPGRAGGGRRGHRGDRDGLAAEVTELREQAAGKGVVTRGCYDVQGLRADADYMFWWIAPSADDLQEMYARFRRTAARPGQRAGLVGDGAAPAGRVQQEPRPGVPGRGGARAYVCVYPFVRSYEWYLLDPPSAGAMLAEHGMMAREYPDVRANTVACFALNDYEWILAFEADELHRIVDLMRHLRGAGPGCTPGWRSRSTPAAASHRRAGRRAAVDPRRRPGRRGRGLTTIASWVDRATTSTASVSGDGFSSRCGTCGGTQTKSPGPACSRVSPGSAGRGRRTPACPTPRRCRSRCRRGDGQRTGRRAPSRSAPSTVPRRPPGRRRWPRRAACRRSARCRRTALRAVISRSAAVMSWPRAVRKQVREESDTELMHHRWSVGTW